MAQDPQTGSVAAQAANDTQAGSASLGEVAGGRAPIDYEAAEPPPTAFDQLGQPGQPTLAPESFALVKQIGRVIVALLHTLTLIYLFFRLGLPRVMRMWLKQGEQTYQVRERLALDNNNTLVRIEHDGGVQYVLGLGSNGIVLIDKLDPPPGGPLPSPKKQGGEFDALLRPHRKEEA